MAEHDSLRGSVEYADRRLIKGWAVDTKALERSPSIRVVAAGQVVAEFAASDFRWDLRARFGSSGDHGFVYPIPRRLLANGQGRFEVCFAATSQPLENSPFELEPANERLHAPFETSHLTGCRVLVLAPHPDDESLTCGGSIILHVQHGDPVKVVYLTDGSQANPASGMSPRRYIALRRREATEACRILGVADVEFWDYQDRGLAVSAAPLDRLCELIAAYRPELIYAPSPQEFHPDHRATAALIWKAVNKTRVDAQVAFYEFNRPIHVNRLVDIDAVAEQKVRACSAHQSQMELHPYTDAAMALSCYRALTVSPAVGRAEGFFVLSGREMIGRPLDWFTVRQHLPAVSSTEAERKPLVSVVVRTRDRPRPLREALASILAQTYANLEVVVVNAGSEDVSPVVAEFESFLPIRLLSSSVPLGRAAAATWGAKEAHGKYLNFLDDDDLLYSDHIEKLVCFIEMTGVRVAYSDCEQGHYEWRDGGIRLVGEPVPFFGVNYDRDRLFCGNYIPFMSALFERTLAEEVGYFDEAFDVLEDWDFWLRASRSTDFHRIPGVTSLYRCFVEKIHSNGLEELYSKHSDEWRQLADSVGKRIHTLHLENIKLDEALASAQSEFKSLRLAELWNTVRELSALPLQKFQPKPALLEKEGVTEEMRLQSFGDWRAAASEPWHLAERLQVRNQELRRQLAEMERRVRGVRRDPVRMLLGFVPRPMLDVVHRAAHSAATALAYREKPQPPAEPVEAVRDAEEIEIRVYQDGDELRISELFRTCFHVERDVDHWRWKYVDHPWGAKNIAVAVGADGRLLAHYAGYRSHFYDATEDEPRIITGMQIGDTMTAPEARRVGRRSTSLLHQMMRFYFDQFCHEKVDLNFGFNTGKIQRFYTRLIEGSRFFEDVPFMVLETDDSAIRRLQETASTLADVQVSRVQQTDAEWDRFFERHASDYGVLTHRTAEYVRWRYLQRPDVDYSLYAAYQDGCLVGWSVFRQDGERLMWGDGLFRRDRVAAFAAILNQALGLFAHRRSRSVEGWFSSRPDWWARAAAEAGFERRPEPDRIAMIYKPFGAEGLDALFDKSLYYSGGDSDLF